MLMMRGIRRTEGPRTARREIRPGVESLEGRAVPSASPAGLAWPMVHAAAVHAKGQPVLGVLQGRVTNDQTGHGLNGVKVQLVAADGHVARTTITHNGGLYRFAIRENAPYVIHVVTPRRFVVTSPTFATHEPEGSYAINPATGLPYTSASWNYFTGNSNPANGPVGPPFWSSVAPAGEEPFESPINIIGPPIDLSQYLTVHYANANASAVVNNGKQIQVQFPATGADTINLDGLTYDLKQFHLHDPSENQVNGRSGSLELHFVNESATGSESVVAVFLRLGAHNDALDPILNAATAALTSPGTSTTLSQPVNFAGLLPRSTLGWFYQGTLTTPPLSGPVNFLVYATPITLDYHQLMQYEKVASGSGFLPNARAVQPLDGRQVNRFGYDVNFHDVSVVGLDFTLSPAFINHAPRRTA